MRRHWLEPYPDVQGRAQVAAVPEARFVSLSRPLP